MPWRQLGDIVYFSVFLTDCCTPDADVASIKLGFLSFQSSRRNQVPISTVETIRIFFWNIHNWNNCV